MERGFTFLGKDEAVAAMESAKRFFVVRFGLLWRQADGLRQNHGLIGTTEQRQGVEFAALALVNAGMLEIAIDHLVYNLLVPLNLFGDLVNIPCIAVECGGDVDGQGDALGDIPGLLQSRQARSSSDL
ncbi:hypothetical protein [Ktedonobacter sp. SOSP1-52]|uniref:hypothetical protein n=1 Tax=Ktedonobacter sp. SOSP1-52 TaxID=2778366 RepID=UPI001915EF4F|nr:hypothetical protein [Ktedonobacter sp. SOSP1-52]